MSRDAIYRVSAPIDHNEYGLIRFAAIKCSELIRKLKKSGCYFVRQGKGSHEVWFNPITEKRFVIPNQPAKEIGKGLVTAIYKKAGI